MTIKNKTTRNVYITYLTSIICFLAIRICAYFFPSFFRNPVCNIAFNAITQLIVIFGISVFLFSGLQKQKLKTTFKFYGYKKISVKAVCITIVMGLVVYVLNIFVATFFDVILQLLGYKFGSSSGTGSYPVYMLIVNLIVTAVLPAICEETAHRGMLLKGSSALGQKKAIIISALLFGLMHMNIEQFFYATMIGLFVGYLSIICDSIYPAMIIHFMNNAMSVFMGFSAAHNLPLAKIAVAFEGWFANNFALALAFSVLLAALLVWLLIYLTRKLFMETTGKNVVNLQQELYKEFAKTDYLNDLEMSKAELRGQEVDDVQHINLEEMYIDKNIQLGLMTDLDRQLLQNDGRYKVSKLAIALIVTCFIMTAAVTILTFVRGVL